MRFLVTDGVCVLNAETWSRMREMVLIVCVTVHIGCRNVVLALAVGEWVLIRCIIHVSNRLSLTRNTRGYFERVCNG